MTRRIELSPRLRLAADLVPEGARLADVGTDHAYLPACLLMEGKIPSAIAADLREGPLSRARETAAEYGCGDRMAFRLCDGLSGIRPEETDAVVIAGMGGETIAQILEAAPWVRTRKIPLVLQPMSSIPELRQRLGEGGFRILEERLAREGRIPTTFGQTLSWEYLRYVRTHPARRWRTPTAILYGARDHLTDRETVEAFAARNGCRLTVEEAGEHWFHTPEQLAVVDRWQRACLADLE